MKEKDEGRRIRLKSLRPQQSLKILEQAGWETPRVPSQEAMPALVRGHRLPSTPSGSRDERAGTHGSTHTPVVNVFNY